MRDVAPQSSHLVGPLLRYAAERGANIELAAFGLGHDALARDVSPIANRDLGRLFDEVARALDEPDLGLLLPAELKFQRYALPELAARASATLRESFEQWAKYASLVHPSVVFEFSEDAGRALFTHRTLGHPRGLSRHLDTFALAASIHFGREGSQLGPRVLEAHFVHARPSSLERLTEFFRTSALFFGAESNALVLDAASLDQPQRTADARLLATVDSLGRAALRQQPARSEVCAEVVRRIRVQLAETVGDVRIRKLARELHMSVRTLQRRLDDEGTSFAELADETRAELARELVSEGDVGLAEIAERLGFADFATFSRAFKRWTGSAPGAFRTHALRER
ncbi:MAG TPA: AraC family transcriptional regulator ligand-binding domain-containing protein [Polyangiales bacterium]|nr:AraC family transcriptional regulator ligand-binding domain-containing protein [Polyangiales bacterium]